MDKKVKPRKTKRKPRCRTCLSTLLDNGTCHYKCAPKVRRQDTCGVKEKLERLITTKEAREGLSRADPRWAKQAEARGSKRAWAWAGLRAPMA